MNTSHTPGTGILCIPVSGRIFEDTVDGYFPLQESIHQLLLRQQFQSAWVSIVEAPFIYLQDLPDTSPVPMKLHADTPTGIIHYMALVATLRDNGIQLSGVARWTWLTGDSTRLNTFPKNCRLAEPAFVRGIGLHPGNFSTHSFGQISLADASSDIALVDLANQSARQSLAKLGWETGLFWGLRHATNDIPSLKNTAAWLGDSATNADKLITTGNSFECLVCNLRDRPDLAVMKKLATEG